MRNTAAIRLEIWGLIFLHYSSPYNRGNNRIPWLHTWIWCLGSLYNVLERKLPGKDIPVPCSWLPCLARGKNSKGGKRKDVRDFRHMFLCTYFYNSWELAYSWELLASFHTWLKRFEYPSHRKVLPLLSSRKEEGRSREGRVQYFSHWGHPSVLQIIKYLVDQRMNYLEFYFFLDLSSWV